MKVTGRTLTRPNPLSLSAPQLALPRLQPNPAQTGRAPLPRLRATLTGPNPLSLSVPQLALPRPQPNPAQIGRALPLSTDQLLMALEARLTTIEARLNRGEF